ncbi:MAG: hypothetical protein QOF51_281 [Chloroflexota bacterium]|jgi:hypothetical protein|nr:hypothetical protein [Chloroflexota bacterium]
MAVTRERFNQGMTYEQFKAQLTGNVGQFEENEQATQLTEADLAPWRALESPVDVVAIVINQCPDVVMNLPILSLIGQKTGKVNIRIFLRDDNKDLIADYMNGRFESVPVFAFFDKEWKPLGVFIERPKSVTEQREQKTREIHERNPEFGPFGGAPTDLPEEVRGRLQATIREMRTATQEDYHQASIQALKAMAEEFNRGIPEGKPIWRGNLLMAVPA